jgi:hypothetical protein
MALTLTTHDTRFDQLDDATIAKVLASLDGSRNVLATLERAEPIYLQAEGGVRAGFILEYQDGSLDQRFRSRNQAVPLAQVTEIFQAYARGEATWRAGHTQPSRRNSPHVAVTAGQPWWGIPGAAVVAAAVAFLARRRRVGYPVI